MISLCSALVRSSYQWKKDDAIKMSADLEFDYEEALKRQNFTEKDVDELRNKIESLDKVPKKLSDKKV